MTDPFPSTALSKQPGVTLTSFGYGAAQLGNLYRETTDEESTAALKTAWDAGVRYFDTAPHYGLGLSERRVGAGLKDFPREELVISTKVGRLLEDSPQTAHLRDDQGFDVPANLKRVADYSRDGVLRSIEESLVRLGTDYLDIAYLHDPDDHWEQASTSGMQGLIELRDQGVVKAIGAGMNQSQMLTRFAVECDVDVLMCAGRYTLLEQPALADLLPAALANDVAIVIAGVYNSGLLARNEVPADATYNYAAAPGDLVARAQRLAEVVRGYGVTLPQVALAFVTGHPAVVSTVIGLRTAAQVSDSVDRLSATIPPQLWQDLKDQGLLAAQTPTP